MENKKQSSIEFIFNAFNLLSDSDFKAWMLNNHDDIKAMHKEEIMESWKHGNLPTFLGRVLTAQQYYNETFGGQDE
jgi:hypothetical protein